MTPARKRLLSVVVSAALLGLLASLIHDRGGLWRTDSGQWVLHAFGNAIAPAPPPGVVPTRLGDTLPALRLRDLEGAWVNLADTGGRKRLINVWASWCGPCIKEMPELNRYARQQGDQGVQVIGLALDNPQDVRAFLRKVPVDYPIVLDTPGPADSSVWLGNTRGVLPYTVLIGSDGRVLKQRIGPFVEGEIERWVGTSGS